jgi:hypothetical protein
MSHLSSGSKFVAQVATAGSLQPSALQGQFSILGMTRTTSQTSSGSSRFGSLTFLVDDFFSPFAFGFRPIVAVEFEEKNNVARRKVG